MVAALYVETGGVYSGLSGVDPWDEARDARLYEGPWPVVAHPPCNHWCQLASVNAARYEGFKVGDDRGCFAAALDAVRRWGGVLEHPAYSLAWEAFGLPRPVRWGWNSQFGEEGWTTELSQSAYGHPARKATWLYAVGLDWNVTPTPHWWDAQGAAVIGGGINSGKCVGRPKLGKRAASATPEAFRDVLLAMARTARSPLAS